ncbi:MAG TPA: hypothetical protein VI789_05710 [Dehalococcoidia bacterium]|nr:hypothetical protein [Dehalococcoidia bacterium]
MDYDLIEVGASYQEGIEQLMEETRRGGSRTAPIRVCLLCSEEDPLRCHRRNLIARTLVRQGGSVQHIGGDGRLESEEEVRQREARMIRPPRQASGKGGRRQTRLL